MTPADLIALAAEAALAPSVHNVQPARWRFSGDRLILWEDMSRRLPAGDPDGRDAATSLGAAAEGMALALSTRGLALTERTADTLPQPEGSLVARRLFGIVAGAEDPLQRFVATRQSYRGAFGALNEKDRRAAAALVSEDCAVVAETDRIAAIALQVDRSGHRFFRDDAFRAELRSWMRLRHSDPRWARDGLNAEAMAMSPLAARGAALVLGPLFRPLDGVGLAAPLTAEATTIKGATAILLFHRPQGEPRFASGRAFYRLWLRVEQAGLRAAVMASLADDPVGAASVSGLLPTGRVLVSALRVGRAPPDSAYPRARLPVEELIV